MVAIKVIGNVACSITVHSHFSDWSRQICSWCYSDGEAKSNRELIAELHETEVIRWYPTKTERLQSREFFVIPTGGAVDWVARGEEWKELKAEIGRVLSSAEFNGVNLLDGSFSGAVFQVGANAGETISVASIVDVNIAALGSVTQSQTSVAVSGISAPGTAIAAGGIEINGVDIGAIGAAGSAVERAGQLVNAINTVSTASGVGATYNASTNEIILTGSGNIAVTGTLNDATIGGLTNATAATASTTTGITTLSVSSYTGAQLAIQQMDSALTQVNTARGNLGALQNRFTSVVASLTATSENLSASRGRIQDADFAKESANMSKNSMLMQSGISMLKQAGQMPGMVMSLLG